MSKRIITAFYFALCLFMIGACTKDPSFQTDKAIVLQIKYACGPACDAATFSIKIKEDFYLSSKPLPEGVMQHNVPVVVSYRKTGKYPTLWEGPINAEIIEIQNIRKR